ncbi:MAG: hypothetical protein JJU02_07435 [Cryomorphaceae bacterium]|nr:hypothetical protein [Cryomorphaceae bacterium]
MNRFLVFCLYSILGLIFPLQGQVENGILDTVPPAQITPDTIIQEKAKKPHSPQKAVYLSMVIPGAGQVYNRKYWKVIPVYGALISTIYFARDNHLQYRQYAEAFSIITNEKDERPDPFNGQFSPEQLITLQNTYLQDRDFMIILAVVSYSLQLVDAYVDAHLFHYDISDDLTLRWEPTINAGLMGFSSPSAGLRLSLTFGASKKRNIQSF